MKILLCARHLVGSGGQEGFLKRLCGFLAARGHTVGVLATAADAMPGVTVTRPPVARQGRRAWRDWAGAQAIAAAAATYPCDVSLGGQKIWGCSVVRPGGGVEADYWDMRLRDRYRWAPLRAIVGRLSTKRRLDLAAEARAYRHPALRCVVANSEIVRRRLAHFYPEVADRVRVVYNGVDTARFRPVENPAARADVHAELGLDPRLLTAVFSGHNFRLKGLPQGLEALALARRAAPTVKCQLVVLGGGRQSGMRRLAHRLGVADGVRFTGGTPCPERFYGAADFLLYPSFYDPCANVTFEALASGLPVITTQRNGASAVVREGRDGWTVTHPDCTGQMARHILALGDPARLAAMRASARDCALQYPESAAFETIEQMLQFAAEAGG